MIINDSFMPINKKKFLEELRKKGIPEATIESINWKNCIEDGYCIYNDKRRKKTCFAKIKNKNNNLCSIHKNRKNRKQEINEIDEIENMLKNMDLDKSKNIEHEKNNIDYLDSISETYCNTETSNTLELNIKKPIECLHLSENGINKLYNNLNILLDNINNYKKGLININGLFECILRYNENVYKCEEGPHVCISFLLQFFEEFHETSNCFLNNIIDNYDNFNMFIELCQKWKVRIKEIANEIIVIPDYYQEYYCIINKKIDNDLFKMLN